MFCAWAGGFEANLGGSEAAMEGAAAKEWALHADPVFVQRLRRARPCVPCSAYWESQGDCDPGFPGHSQFYHVPRTPQSPPVPSWPISGPLSMEFSHQLNETHLADGETRAQRGLRILPSCEAADAEFRPRSIWFQSPPYKLSVQMPTCRGGWSVSPTASTPPPAAHRVIRPFPVQTLSWIPEWGQAQEGWLDL